MLFKLGKNYIGIWKKTWKDNGTEKNLDVKLGSGKILGTGKKNKLFLNWNWEGPSCGTGIVLGTRMGNGEGLAV